MATREQRASLYNGYYRVSNGEPDPQLTQVGPGTACGEYLRRFWMPVAMTEQVGELPTVIKVLGEELVLFRDLGGRYGLLHKHCSHRRASLEYGIISEQGIRCCYHGWLYDVNGRILETPGEAEGSPIRRNLCHGAYPVYEYAGLVFAYLGPPELKPAFPMLDTMALPDDELVPYAIDYSCNWLQVAENPMDPFHSVFLHTRVTRAHFNPAWGAIPVVEWHPLADDTGIYLTNVRRWESYIWVRTAEVMLPAVAQPPDIYQNPDREKFFPRAGITKWTVPVDDSHCRIIAWRHFSDQLDLDGKGDRRKVGLNKVDFVGQTGIERSYEDGQKMPGDYEAQISQGPITVHSEEQLATTDKGVALYRRMLRKAITALADGQEPSQLAPETEGVIPTLAGDVIVEVPISNHDDIALQRRLGKEIGAIVRDTAPVSRAERSGEIELRVRGLLTSDAIRRM
ncbi:MAG: aromatic ring-hydroxylating dioxygenase subunit alpha [Candidatus Tectomicrobia bacterium]